MERYKVITLIISLMIFSSLALFIEAMNRRDEKKIQLQRFLSGIGLGAVISPEWGFLNYDPRIDFVDETSLWPIPGGYSYSPERVFSIADMKEPQLNSRKSKALPGISDAEAFEPLNIEHPIKNPPLYTDHKRCDNCGMDRNKWARTRYDFETSKGRFYTCSIHCLTVMAYHKLKEEPRNVKVAEYLRPERMLDAEKSFFVIGSIAPGTMSSLSIIAFSSRDEAEGFAMKYGGRVTDFRTALQEVKKEINQRQN